MLLRITKFLCNQKIIPDYIFLPLPIHTHTGPCVVVKGGTVRGPSDCCHFPFEYKGKTYTECTKVDGRDDDKPWCYTEEKLWGYCQLPGGNFFGTSSVLHHLETFYRNSGYSRN